MDYMNQSLKRPVIKYAENKSYTDVVIDYAVTRQDDKILSVLFKGNAYMKGIGKINIMESVNLDIGESTNLITYDNIIKNTDTTRQEVKKILDDAAKEKGIQGGFEAEGVRLYFSGEYIIFFYMPLDDAAREFIELIISKLTIKPYLNSDFGAKPAS